MVGGLGQGPEDPTLTEGQWGMCQLLHQVPKCEEQRIVSPEGRSVGGKLSDCPSGGFCFPEEIKGSGEQLAGRCGSSRRSRGRQA